MKFARFYHLFTTIFGPKLCGFPPFYMLQRSEIKNHQTVPMPLIYTLWKSQAKIINNVLIYTKLLWNHHFIYCSYSLIPDLVSLFKSYSAYITCTRVIYSQFCAIESCYFLSIKDDSTFFFIFWHAPITRSCWMPRYRE